MTTTPRATRTGKCSYCSRTRAVFTISRRGGGTYRRGNRTYRSSVCGDCVIQMLPGAAAITHAMATHHGYGVDTLVSIAEALVAEDPARMATTYPRHDGPSWEPRDPVLVPVSDLVASYRTAVAERQAAYEARRAAYEA